MKLFDIVRANVVIIELDPEIKHVATLKLFLIVLFGKTVYSTMPKKYKDSIRHCAYLYEGSKEQEESFTNELVKKFKEASSINLPIWNMTPGIVKGDIC